MSGPGLEAVEREARVPAKAWRLAARQQGADQRDVLAHLGHRVSDVLPVPAAHRGSVTCAEPEPEAAAGQVVDRGGRLGHRRGRAVVDRGHRRSQGDRRGEVGKAREGSERIAGGDVRAVDRVVAELIGQRGVLAHGGDVAGGGDQHACLHRSGRPPSGQDFAFIEPLMVTDQSVRAGELQRLTPLPTRSDAGISSPVRSGPRAETRHAWRRRDLVLVRPSEHPAAVRATPVTARPDPAARPVSPATARITQAGDLAHRAVGTGPAS